MTIMLELDAADQLAMVATSTTIGFGPEYDEAIAAAAAKRQRDEEDGNNIAGGTVRSSAASSRVGPMPSAKRRTGKVVEVSRVSRTESTLSKWSASGSGLITWSTTPNANPGPSGPRGGTQRVQGTPSFALPPNARSTQNQATQPADDPSFGLGPNFQSTPHPPPQSQHEQRLIPQGTPSFVLPPNAQSTQRPPSPPSFSLAPKAQSTLQPKFQMPSQTAPSQRPKSSLSSTMLPPPPPPRPLFLPPSQFSQAGVLEEAGLEDLQHMTQKELDAMLEDEDEEEVPGTPEHVHLNMNELEELFNESDFDASDSQVVGTQGASVARIGDKVSLYIVRIFPHTYHDGRPSNHFSTTIESIWCFNCLMQQRTRFKHRSWVNYSTIHWHLLSTLAISNCFNTHE